MPISILTSTTPRTTSMSTIPVIINRCRKCLLPSVAACFDFNGGFLQHETRLPSAQFTALPLLHSWHTTWASWLSHTGADLVFVFGKTSWTCSWTSDNCGCCPVIRQRCVKSRPCTPPSTMLTAALQDCFAQGATQPGGRPPTDLTKQTSAIIISSASSSLLLTTPTVHCATPVSVLF